MRGVRLLLAGCLAALALGEAGPAEGQANADRFSMVLLPDTQGYAEDVIHQMYRHQAEWIVEHQEERNIRFVVHLGDITQFNLRPEWELASRAHALLDEAGIPYVMSSGNHDIFPAGQTHRRESYFSEYFGPQRFAERPWYGGSFEAASENSFSRFEAGGHRWLVLSVEFVPRKDVVTWANRTIRQHPDHHVIVATHCHSSAYGEHTAGEAERSRMPGREGIDLWEELLAHHSNLFLVLSGHVPGVSYRRRVGHAGNPVHELLTDFQTEPLLATHIALGNGWLRVLEVDPDAGTVQVETLSAEDGNPRVFPGGEARLFDRYDRISSPSDSRHNRLNYTFTHDFRRPRGYSYVVNDQRYKDRVAHRSLTGTHGRPCVASLTDGAVVVAWEQLAEGSLSWQVRARVFDADGNAATPEIRVAGNGHRQPAVAARSGGGFVLAWQSDEDGDGQFDIVVQNFGADGLALTAPRTANRASGPHRRPAAAMDDDGRLALVWDSEGSDGEPQSQLRLLDENLMPTTPQQAITAPAGVVASNSEQASVAMGAGGDFVVAWASNASDDRGTDVWVRGYRPDGTERFAGVRVNAPGSARNDSPTVGMDGEQQSVVAWRQVPQTGPQRVLARGFNAAGAERVAEFSQFRKAPGPKRALPLPSTLPGASP